MDAWIKLRHTVSLPWHTFINIIFDFTVLQEVNMDCFLCNLLRENPKFREKREGTKKFSEEILRSCKQFLKARIHYQHKYKDVVLPDSWNDEIIGYHSSCYKEFRVKAKYLSYER